MQNNHTQQSDSEFHLISLALNYLDHTATTAELAELDWRLKTCSQAREVFCKFLALESLLPMVLTEERDLGQSMSNCREGRPESSDTGWLRSGNRRIH